MTPSTATDTVTLIATHKEHGFLVYVQEGNIETDAVVKLDDPELQLLIPAEQIETGNSLAWLTFEQVMHPDLKLDYPEGFFTKKHIGAEDGVSEPS